MAAPDQPQPDRQQPEQPVAGSGLLIGRPFGVPIYIAPSWLVFLAFITVQFAPVVASSVPGIGSQRYAVAAAFGIFLGISVLAHEVAHCVVARRLGIPVERISLSFLAGHSALAQEPGTPGRTTAIAAAGPLVNLAIAAGSWFAYRQFPDGGIGSVLSAGLTGTNALVGLYNLLPGLPLDGGQILRALIWRITGRQRSGTIGAAWAGRFVAALTAAGSILLMAGRSSGTELGALWGLVVAGMLWLSSTSVLRQQSVRDRLPGISARRLSRSAISVSADLPLAEAVRRAQEAHAHGIVIVDGGGVPTGVVKEAAVNATPAQRRPWVSVGSVSRQITSKELVDVGLSGEDLLKRLRVGAATEYVVIDQAGQIFGVLAAVDVAREMSGSRRPGPPVPNPAT